MSSSMTCSLTGAEVGWITKTSIPRRLSSILTRTSPSLKRERSIRVSGMSRWSAMARASLGLELPASTRRLSSRTRPSPARCRVPNRSANLLLRFARRLTPLSGPGFLVCLAGAPDRERISRHVFGHHRAGGGVGALSHLHRRHQRGVRADEGPRADARQVLVPAVVVAGDGAGADVGLFPHHRVADVSKMPDGDAVRYFRLLQFDEVSDLHLSSDAAARPQLGEGADPRVVAHLTVREDGVLGGHAVSQRAAGDSHVGTDVAVLTDDRAAGKPGHGPDHRIRADAHARVDVRGQQILD